MKEIKDKGFTVLLVLLVIVMMITFLTLPWICLGMLSNNVHSGVTHVDTYTYEEQSETMIQSGVAEQ